MKKLQFLTWALLALFMAVGFSACSKDDDKEEPYLNVNDPTGVIEAAGGSLTASVSSNITWTAESDDSWLKVSPTSGTGDGTVTLTAEANTSYDARSTSVTVSYEADGHVISHEFTVMQAGLDKPTYHFDLLISVGATTGMSSTGVTAKLIRCVEPDDLVNSNYTISFKGQGADITADMDCESVIHGAYYYEAAPLSKSEFAKFQVTNEKATAIARYEMGTSVLQSRKYAHAWISDNEIVYIGSDKASSKGSKNNIVWAKLKDNGTTLALEGEGTLDLASATTSFKDGGITAYSTSGLAIYRKSTNDIVYAFTDKATDAASGFFVAFIDASTMAVKSVINETRVDEMGGTAFGILQQDKLFLDENENVYITTGTQIAGTSKATQQYGRLVRINKGETQMDASYLGFSDYSEGKIIAADYMSNNKIMLYIMDPHKAGLASSITEYKGWGQNDYSCYYAVYDLTTGKMEDVKFDGNVIWSCGSFTDRVEYYNGKCYIGTCPDNSVELPAVYIYDVATGNVTKGATVEAGYYFNRLNVVQNAN